MGCENDVAKDFLTGNSPRVKGFGPQFHELLDDVLVHGRVSGMKNFTAVVEREVAQASSLPSEADWKSALPGAHSQAESLDVLNANLREVVAMLRE